MTQQRFSSFRKVLVPVIYGSRRQTTLNAAWALDAQIILAGLVPVSPDESISQAASSARWLRRQLHRLTDNQRIRSRARVFVSHEPWNDLVALIKEEEPDLLLLDLDWRFGALGITPVDALSQLPCNVALIRGPFPKSPLRILIPIRGGPHAETALRTALSFKDSRVTAIHLNPAGDRLDGLDAPFRGLERVLAQIPEVRNDVLTTDNPAQTILEQSCDNNLIVIGTTAQSLNSSVLVGPVADEVLKRATQQAVMVVKNRRAVSQTFEDQSSGAQAISILVDKWFAENTFHADEFADLKRLMFLKERGAVTISLALPAWNEEATVAHVIRTIKQALMIDVPLLDEIVLVDSNSTDRTREMALAQGIPVHIHQKLLPELDARNGKGEGLWKSLLVTYGDIVIWIDTDIVNIHPRFVYGILGPLLLTPRVQFVKGFYRRPLKRGGKLEANAGGRVTELTARPLLNLFYPELSGVIQPLSGEYAARRSFLEQVPFFSSYGVEIGLLIEAFEVCGLSAIAQVDLLERIHHNQSLEALSKMSFVILQALVRKLERRHGQQIMEDVNKSMKLIRSASKGYFLDVEEIIEHERPPMLAVPQYQAWRKQIGRKLSVDASNPRETQRDKLVRMDHDNQ